MLNSVEHGIFSANKYENANIDCDICIDVCAAVVQISQWIDINHSFFFFFFFFFWISNIGFDICDACASASVQLS